MRRSERGGVFLVTLAVLTGLVLLLAGLANGHQEQMRALENRSKQARANLMADSGIQEVVAVLQQQSKARTTLSDPWAKLGNRGDTVFQVGNGGFRVQVIDTCSQIDLNVVDQAGLKQLPLSEEQQASLLDWREPSQTPRTNGAKDDYYNGLPRPYSAKLLPFDSTDELLLVRGFSPEALFAPSSTLEGHTIADFLTVNSISKDQDISGNAKLDANSATQDQLLGIGIPANLANAILQAPNRPFRQLADVLNVQGMTTDAAHAIADNLQVGTNAIHPGLLNINTASSVALSTVPNLTPDLVTEIQNRQSTGFRSLGELLDLPGMDVSALAKVIDKFCVSSRTFQVRVIGVSGRMNAALEVLLEIGDDGQVKVSRVQPEPFIEARKRWNWNVQASEQQVIGGVS